MLFSRNNLKVLVYRRFFKENINFTRYICNKKSYKVLFFGSDSIALSSLKKINQLRKSENVIEKLNVVTANSSKQPTLIEKYAKSENLNLLSWPLTDIKQAEYDVGLIVAFGHLIAKDLLEKFSLGMINVHPSLLPRWRGAAPIIHTLLHGDDITGVSLMKIKADKFDVGEIINQIRVPVPKDIKLPELTNQLSELGADMLTQCMRTLPESLAQAQPQPNEGVTYAKKISKNISFVNWSEMTSVQVYNLYRAIYGLHTPTTHYGDKKIKLFDAFLDISDIVEDDKMVGTLDYCDKKLAVRVLCKDRRYIYFKSLRIVGKRQISASDFYNGYIKNMPKAKTKFVLC